MNLVQGNGISPKDKTGEMLIRFAPHCRTPRLSSGGRAESLELRETESRPPSAAAVR
jgi:hypothetical protein